MVMSSQEMLKWTAGGAGLLGVILTLGLWWWFDKRKKDTSRARRVLEWGLPISTILLVVFGALLLWERQK